MNPKLIISNYFDSLVNRIDIHTEEQLKKTKETDLIAIEKPFTYKESQLKYFRFLSEYDLSNQPSRQIPTGSIKVLDYLNETRDKLIAVVNAAQGEAIKRCDDIRDELNLISKDVTKTKEQRDEEIKGKVFANKFLGLVQIDQIFIYENQSPFKLYLVNLDYYMGQHEQFLFWYFYFKYLNQLI